MSAFICSSQHISAIVRYACKNNVTACHGDPLRRWSVAGDEQAIAAILFTENLKSVNHRYREDTPDTGITFDPFAPDLLPIEVIKACNCLAYQSCEHPDWSDSLASRLLTEVQRKALTQLPGYAEAPWEIT